MYFLTASAAHASARLGADLPYAPALCFGPRPSGAGFAPVIPILLPPPAGVHEIFPARRSLCRFPPPAAPRHTPRSLSGAHPGCLIRAPSICAHHIRLRICAFPASPHTPPKKRREVTLFPLYSAAAAWYTAAVIRRGAGARRLRCSAMPLRTLDLIRVMPA